ncbi:MAG TPA: hypothetical protein VI322_02150 [Candidatus Saccharimonadia bacterium]
MWVSSNLLVPTLRIVPPAEAGGPTDGEVCDFIAGLGGPKAVQAWARERGLSMGIPPTKGQLRQLRARVKRHLSEQ